MAHNEGWVSIHRKIFDNPLWELEAFTKAQAWVDLILLANHQDGEISVRGNVLPIKRGQVGRSEVRLAQRWKWSRNKVRRYLKYLETKQQIEQQKGSISSIITILNYNKYQQNDTADGTAERQQKDSRRYTNNNDNKNNNDNNIDMFGNPISRTEPEGEADIPYDRTKYGSFVECFQDYIGRFNKAMDTSYRGDSIARGHLSARLKEGWTLKDIGIALGAASKDPHLMGKNDRQKVYLTPEFILRERQLNSWYNTGVSKLNKQKSNAEYDRR